MKNIEVFLPDTSRITADMAAHHIANNPAIFHEVVNWSFEAKYPFNMRASRVIQIYSASEPKLIIRMLDDIITKLVQTKNSSVRRNFLMILVEKVPMESLISQPLLLNSCFDWLVSDNEPVSLKYYALKLLIRYSKVEPDLMNELTIIMNALEVESSKGLKNYWSKISKFKDRNIHH